MKKLALALAFAFASVLTAPQAAAYKQVCMFGKAGIGWVGKFRLVWGVPDENEVWRRAGFGYPLEGGHDRFSGGFASQGATHWSSTFRLGTRKCVNLDRVPARSRFVVQVQDLPAVSGNFLCSGWEDDRGRDKIGVLINNPRNQGALHLDAWGSKYSPYCRPVSGDSNTGLGDHDTPSVEYLIEFIKEKPTDQAGLARLLHRGPYRSKEESGEAADTGSPDPNRVNRHGFSAMHVAAGHSLEALRAFFLPNSTSDEWRADPNLPDRRGFTLMHWALERLPVVEFLLNQGADPNRVNYLGNTVLHEAALKGRKDAEIYELLIHRGADPLLRNRKGQTALEVAASDAARAALARTATPSVDHLIEFIKKNPTDQAGLTRLLHLGAYRSSGEAADAGPNRVNRHGFSAMHVAAKTSLEALRAFFPPDLADDEWRADPNLPDRRGYTLLHWTMDRASPPPVNGTTLQIAEFLLDQGADPNRVSELGGTVLHEAALKGWEDAEIYELLIRRGADPSLKNNEGLTALEVAASDAARAALEPAVKQQ